MTIHTQPFRTWAIILTLLHVIAILSTTFRFTHRKRTGRAWVDDYVALAVIPVDLLYLIVLWLRYKFGNPNYSTDLRIALYFLSGIPFFIVVWVSRISIALSIIRVLPEQRNLRRFIYGLAIFFGLVCLGLILQVAAYCNVHTSWHQSAGVQCTGNTWISAFTFDVIGDVALVGIPIAALYRLKLPRNQRRLVQTIFSASILTCLASIAVHTFILGPDSWGLARGTMILFMSHVEATTCLMVSNLLAFVGIFYSRFHSGVDLEGDTMGSALTESVTKASVAADVEKSGKASSSSLSESM